MLREELHFQCERLLKILCPDIEPNIECFISKLLKSKVLRMLHAVSEMSKQKWFEELQYSMDSTDLADQVKDLEEIEKLQQLYKRIKSQSEQK